MALKVTTNNHERKVLRWSDLTNREMRQYDWMTEHERKLASFFRYSRILYYMGDFGLVADWHPLGELGWQYSLYEGVWSGMVYKFAENEAGNYDPNWIVVGWWCE